jgi:predicted dehydrogenase
VMAVTDILVEGLGVFGSLPAWMFSKSQAGGGVGLTSGIHLLDHVAWITGQTLTLESASFRCSPKLGDIENVASFSLHLSKGAPVQVLLCWRPETGDLAGELSVFGNKGTLTMQVWGGWKLTNERGLQKNVCFDEHLTVAQRACEGMKLALTEFVQAVHEQRDPVPSAEESLVSQRLIEQAYRYASDRNS